MGFSFNWAGVSIPQASMESNSTIQNRVRTDAAALGQAARGYNLSVADKEYGELLKGYRESNSPERVAALKQELATLKARNAEIAAQLGM